MDSTPPIISLFGNKTFEVSHGTFFEDPGFKAIDPEEGDISERVKVSGLVNVFKEGNYELSYQVSDSAGNPAQSVIRTVVVSMNLSPSTDSIPPVLTLFGESTIRLKSGNSWNDPGASALDNVDGDLSNVITVIGSVNSGQAGTYYLRYNVSDNSGNSANEVIRTVIVSASSSTTSEVPSFAPDTPEPTTSEVLSFAPDTPELLMQAVPLSGGWRSSSWFGEFYGDSSPWLYHLSLGWIYLSEENENTWLYSEVLGWLWTNSSHYPYIYCYDEIYGDGTWMYLNHSTYPVKIYVFNTESWQLPNLIPYSP